MCKWKNTLPYQRERGELFTSNVVCYFNFILGNIFLGDDSRKFDRILYFFLIKLYTAIPHNVIRTLLLCRCFLWGCGGGRGTMRISYRHSSSLIFLFYSCRTCVPGIRKCFFFFFYIRSAESVEYSDLCRSAGVRNVWNVFGKEIWLWRICFVWHSKEKAVFFVDPSHPSVYMIQGCKGLTIEKSPTKRTLRVFCVRFYSPDLLPVCVCLPTYLGRFVFFFLFTSHH